MINVININEIITMKRIKKGIPLIGKKGEKIIFFNPVYLKMYLLTIVIIGLVIKIANSEIEFIITPSLKYVKKTSLLHAFNESNIPICFCLSYIFV